MSLINTAGLKIREATRLLPVSGRNLEKIRGDVVAELEVLEGDARRDGRQHGYIWRGERETEGEKKKNINYSFT